MLLLILLELLNFSIGCHLENCHWNPVLATNSLEEFG